MIITPCRAVTCRAVSQATQQMEDRLQKLIEESEGSDLETADSSPSAVAIVRFVRHQVRWGCSERRVLCSERRGCSERPVRRFEPTPA